MMTSGTGSPVPASRSRPRYLRRVILVVDDDVELRSVVRSALERDGFTVDEAGDGAVALTKIATLAPELVVLDLCLPTVGGLDVLRTMSAAAEPAPPAA